MKSLTHEKLLEQVQRVEHARQTLLEHGVIFRDADAARPVACAIYDYRLGEDGRRTGVSSMCTFTPEYARRYILGIGLDLLDTCHEGPIEDLFETIPKGVGEVPSSRFHVYAFEDDPPRVIECDNLFEAILNIIVILTPVTSAAAAATEGSDS